jgi:hypothetical protein
MGALRLAEPAPIKWSESARGNLWARIGDLHIVIFQKGNSQK